MMKKPWSAKFITNPTEDMVLEAFADAILRNEKINKLFKITIEEQ